MSTNDRPPHVRVSSATHPPDQNSLPTHREFSVVLDEKHAALLRSLFLKRLLVDRQDDELDFDDAFARFVSLWLEVRQVMVRTVDQE